MSLLTPVNYALNIKYGRDDKGDKRFKATMEASLPSIYSRTASSAEIDALNTSMDTIRNCTEAAGYVFLKQDKEHEIDVDALKIIISDRCRKGGSALSDCSSWAGRYQDWPRDVQTLLKDDPAALISPDESRDKVWTLLDAARVPLAGSKVSREDLIRICTEAMFPTGPTGRRSRADERPNSRRTHTSDSRRDRRGSERSHRSSRDAEWPERPPSAAYYGHVSS